MIKKKLKLNAPLRGYPAGTVLPITVDNKGVPTERYWRDRLKDAKKDKCVEFVGSEKKTTPPKSTTGGDK